MKKRMKTILSAVAAVSISTGAFAATIHAEEPETDVPEITVEEISAEPEETTEETNVDPADAPTNVMERMVIIDKDNIFNVKLLINGEPVDYRYGCTGALPGDVVTANPGEADGYIRTGLKVSNPITGEVFATFDAEEDSCQFIMPDQPVMVTVLYDLVRYHIATVYKDPTELNPTVSGAAVTEATVEDHIVCNPKNCFDYDGEDDEIEVLDAQGNRVPVTNAEFDMPASDVTVISHMYDNVRYLDENGEAQSLEKGQFKELGDMADTSFFNSGWYVVTGEVTLAKPLFVRGNLNIILRDGAHLNATQGIVVNQGHSLTIYGQEEMSGRLEATGREFCAGIGTAGSARFSFGDITINGGTVIARGGAASAGIGEGYNSWALTQDGSITINNGNVEAYGDLGSAGIGGAIDVLWSAYGEKFNVGYCGNITINGGNVKAVGSVSSCFVKAKHPDIDHREDVQYAGSAAIGFAAVSAGEGSVTINGGNVLMKQIDTVYEEWDGTSYISELNSVIEGCPRAGVGAPHAYLAEGLKFYSGMSETDMHEVSQEEILSPTEHAEWVRICGE